ncbi:MAG TPA: citrate synthase family protein [Caulobacteraceae bacterium]|jgi:citrate synthase|nr:citrate synthase family protein [Caulobacteraceae bacterium]
MPDWLSAEEALARLRVRPQTLYAYVSRGRLRAEPDPDEPRRSRYRASDVSALAQRKARGRKAADVAVAAIAWGEPVLASAITTVRDGRLYYRGEDAIGLSETATLEAVARLLRGGLGLPPDEPQDPPSGPTARSRAFAAFALRAEADPPSQDRPAHDLAGEAAELLDLMAAAIAGPEGAVPREEDAGAIHERLGRAWRAPRDQWDAIRRALVLLADHELNASTFAARVAASTGASLAAAVLAGLSALSGPRHGGMAGRVEAFAEAASARDWRRALGPAGLPPGFGHALYPDGDPRAVSLLAAIEVPAALQRLRREVEAASGQRANVDFALVALRRALGLPAEAPFALFALGRTAGWLAHAIEQIETGAVIRPRARYVGPAPVV